MQNVFHLISWKYHKKKLQFPFTPQVTVIDTSDPDWWQGKLLGRTGYFPSKYCVRLNANEKPLQVVHNLQVSDGERGELQLLRDQIVIQVEMRAILMQECINKRVYFIFLHLDWRRS